MEEETTIDRQRKLFCALLGVEGLVILVSGLLAADKVEWAYGILCCSPVGGILSLFYRPADFFFGFNAAAWFLSGIQFLLVNYVLGQVGKTTKRAPLLFVHSLAFTFFSGVLVSKLIDWVILPARNGLSTWFQTASGLGKLSPVFLILLYYLAALGCLFLTLRTFWGNLKMLGVVLVVNGGLMLLLRVALTLLANGIYGGEAVAGVIGFLAQAPETHPFLTMLARTIFISAVYDWGLVLLHNAKENVQALNEELDYEIKIDKMKKALRYAGYPTFRKKLMAKADPDGVQESLDLLAEYDLATMEEMTRAFDRREETAKEQYLEENTTPEELPELLLRDSRTRCLWKGQKKLLRMSVKRFCKRWVPDRRTLEDCLQALPQTEFAYRRLSYPEKDTCYLGVVLKVSLLFSLVMWAVFMLCLPLGIMAPYYVCSFLLGFSLAYTVLVFPYMLVRKDRTKNAFEAKACLPMAAIAGVFGLLITSVMMAHEIEDGYVYWFVASLMGPLAFCSYVMYLDPVKQALRRTTYIARRELREIYRHAHRERCELRGKHMVSVMICCALRREEILDYLERD